MNSEIPLPREASPFKRGDKVIYTYPRKKRGFTVPPEPGIIKNVYKDGYVMVELRHGKRRQVKIQMLTLVG